MTDDSRRPAPAPNQGANSSISATAAGHPAPSRSNATLGALWFGLLGAPVAWSVQTLVNFPLASHACFPHLSPLATPTVGGLRGIVFIVSLAALAACVAAAAVAWRTWQRTRGEGQEGSGRARAHLEGAALLETGEGRTRFMALAGVLTSAMFFVASLAHVATVFIVRPCGA